MQLGLVSVGNEYHHHHPLLHIKTTTTEHEKVSLSEVFKDDLAPQINWTLFASFEEDKTYRKQGKWKAYKYKRVILYDNTNINLHQPSDAENQRNTYSM